MKQPLYILEGVVEPGNRIGRTLGLPTANIALPHDAPPRGVYAARVMLPDGRICEAVTDVGSRPTVADSAAARAESHLLDFSGDLYGKRIRVELWYFLREERKFASMEALAQEIRRNIMQAKEYFADTASL
ncbi:MAG: hypothetical protein ABT01_01255 [Clostridium sp. SCN 57-10]|nr:MAG: hypothetical protein ABT01_01255 [Clostridium sp. SCN 57-10]